MTYEELYEPAVREYKNRWHSYFTRFQPVDISGMNLLRLQDELDRCNEVLMDLASHRPTPFSFDLSAALQEQFASLIRSYDASLSLIKNRFQNQRTQREAEHVAQLSEVERVAEASVDGLTQKYDKLLTYKDKVTKAVLHYGISPSDLDLDLDSMSRAEVEQLFDTALSACAALGDSKSRLKLEDIYTLPDEERTTRVNRAITILFLFLLFSPALLVVMFGYLYRNTLHVARDVEGLRLADKLMYGINFAKYRDAPKYEDIPDIDYSDIDSAEAAQLASLEAQNPRKQLEELQDQINRDNEKIAAAYADATREVVTRHNELYVTYQQRSEQLSALIEDYRSKLQEFGSVCNASYVMDTKFTLGKARGLLDTKYDVGARNLIFADRSPAMLQFMKLLLANAMLSVRARQFSCTIYDPERLGADFATFISQDTAAYINIATGDFNKLLEAHRAYSLNNLRILDQQDINTFNTEAERQEMVTLEYHLLIIVSGVEKPLEDKLLTEFIQFSARTGALVWLVASQPLPECIFYRKPFEGVESPYPLTPALFNQVMNTFKEAFVKQKDKGISYKQAFADRYLPESKWWAENTDEGIKLNFGLQDGDPSKGYDLVLGDGNVHGLCVGTTGAGKSVLNNQLIASLITRYPPSALELILVDFKNVEFRALTHPDTQISRIPHARVVAGTKDGEYAVSIFDYLIAEMNRRTAIFGEAGVKKVEEYNKKMRTLGTPEKCLPRVLVLIDEFQVMFTEVEQKAVETIQARIRSLAKLARFCGCHMFFTSQNMKGTMPKDVMEQFTLRVALRCSGDTSRDIIGSDAASKFKTAYGYLYTNTSGGETQDSTKLWRTPFISTEVLFETLDKVEALCAERGEHHHHAYFYDEDERYPASQLTTWLEEHKPVVEKEQRLMVLGERTGFSLKTTPVNFKLKRADGENIFFYAFEEVDFKNLAMTLVDNVRANSHAKLLLNSADEDLLQLLDVESWYDPDYMDIAHPMTDITDWLYTLRDLVDQRAEMDPSEYTPIYFLCLRWDKQTGIGKDDSYKLTDLWNGIVRDAPSKDIHILFGIQTYKGPALGSFGSFDHIICAKGSADASYRFLEDKSLSKLPETLGIALYRYGSSTQKFKLYQHTFTKEAETREVNI